MVYRKNKGSATTLKPPYDIDSTKWTDGEYSITVYAEDKAGNSKEEMFVFTKDASPPQISLKSPFNNSLVDDSTVLDFEVDEYNIWKVGYSLD